MNLQSLLPKRSLCVLIFFVVRVCGAQQAFYGNPSLVFTPFHADGMYKVGEQIGWSVKPVRAGVATRYRYEARQNNREVIASGTIDVAGGSAAISFPAKEAELVLVEVTPVVQVRAPAGSDADFKRQRLDVENLLGAAVEPTKLRPTADAPGDFDAFWDGKLRELAAIPMHPSLTALDARQSGVTLSAVKLESVGSHVQGYLAEPSADGKYPALVRFQSAGVYALKPTTATRYAAEGWLVFDVDSHDMAPDQAEGAPADYAKVGDSDRESSYFLNMYLRDKRAVEFVQTLRKWDGRTIVLAGTSMGGQQSLATAGLCGRAITAVIVDLAAGADTNGDLHGRKAGYPYWNSKDPRVARTALYFDPVNFAPRIEAPVIMGVGLIDVTSPPAGVYTVYNQLRVPKEMIPMVESAHNNVTPNAQGAFHAEETRALELLRSGAGLKLGE